MLRVVLGADLSHGQLITCLFHRGAYGGMDDYLETVRRKRGFEAAEGIQIGMREMIDRYTDEMRIDWQAAQREARHTYGPIGFLLSIPEADFLIAIEAGVTSAKRAERRKLPTALNEVCERRGLPFRMTGDGPDAKFERSGDSVISEVVVAPVLSALADPRLEGGAGIEFNGARDQLRANTPESRKRSVGEACSAVESTMRVVLKEHGRELPKPTVLTKLVDRLIAEGLMERELREILEAPGFFGNRKSRHGGGEAAHEISEATAEAAVAAAAVAIVYLARQLPPQP